MRVHAVAVVVLSIIIIGVALIAITQSYQVAESSEVSFKLEVRVVDDQMVLYYTPNSLFQSSYEIRYYVISEKDGETLEYHGVSVAKDISLTAPLRLWAMKEEGRSYEVYTRIIDEKGKILHYSVALISEKTLSEEEWKKIGERFVEKSPTYTFDGFDLNFVKMERKGEKLILTYEFSSKHSGYGERTDEILLQVITPHEVVLTVEKNAMVSAVMDDKWDMMNQRFLR
jgi:hypothetical protein